VRASAPRGTAAARTAALTRHGACTSPSVAAAAAASDALSQGVSHWASS
jgi:hypothetical protein